MSSVIIEDGFSGKANKVHVDDHGRAYVLADVVSHEQHHAVYHQNLFVSFFETTLQGSAETPIAFFRNTSPEKEFEIYTIDIECDDTIQVNAYFTSTYTSGGNAVVPVNTNRGSNKRLTGEFYQGGATANLNIDRTTEIQFGRYFVKADEGRPLDFKGAAVLTDQTSIHFTAIGALDDNVSITILSSWHDVGASVLGRP